MHQRIILFTQRYSLHCKAVKQLWCLFTSQDVLLSNQQYLILKARTCFCLVESPGSNIKWMRQGRIPTQSTGNSSGINWIWK